MAFFLRHLRLSSYIRSVSTTSPHPSTGHRAQPTCVSKARGGIKIGGVGKRNLGTADGLLTGTRRGGDAIRSVEASDAQVKVVWESGTVGEYPAFWLRDHCRSHSHYSHATRQRLFPTHMIPMDLKPLRVRCQDQQIVEVEWDDGHRSQFEGAWLRMQVKGEEPEDRLPKRKLWLTPPVDMPRVAYGQVMESDAGLLEALHHVRVHGYVLITQTPLDKTGVLCERIARPRETHYGRIYVSEPDMAHGDLAYTTEALAPHTDTTYFTDPVGYQMLHVTALDGRGGESILVDGFACAEKLDREAYQVLRTTLTRQHCAGDLETYLEPARQYPILNHTQRNNLYQIRFNDADRSPLLPPHLSPPFYRALRQWHDLVMSESHWLVFSLRPGTALVFDNWRLLHGRKAFSGNRRRVEGCYWGRDEVFSRHVTLAGAAGREAL